MEYCLKTSYNKADFEAILEQNSLEISVCKVKDEVLCILLCMINP